MGARGDAVVWLQARLRTWGVPVARTGLYRAQTRAAVRAFQRARGLQADGVAGPLTWAVLLEQPG
jgi:peptidoglycan hydrolase-like protein with peptidoglycan-binding domain